MSVQHYLLADLSLATAAFAGGKFAAALRQSPPKFGAPLETHQPS
jgi:hypothetical protein